MAIADDFSVAANGDIRYTGSTANYTVIAFHRWLGDLMDDAQASGNDILDISDATASERATDNLVTLNSPYNIDATAAEHLYDGSIVQSNGDEIWDGIVCYAPAGIPLEVIQNGAKVTNFWSTTYNADAANGISHRFMVKVRTAAADIDGRRLIGQTRDFGKQYSEFVINGTARGNNVLALASATDLNNQTAAATVATWTGITNTTEGFAQITIGGTAYDFYSEWNTNQPTRSINQFYERMKWLTRGTDGDKSASTIYGLNGELFRGPTHEIAVSSGTGTWGTPEHEQITWSGGTGRLLAVDNKTGSATTKLWYQLLTGVASTNTQVLTGTTSSATATQSGAATSRPLSFPFIGASTGSAIIGAYGVGIEAADLTASDKVFDLTNTQRTPPNNVTFTVGPGLVSGEDRVLVAPLGYRFAWDNEGGTPPFQLGETLTFTSPAGTGYLSYLRDDGTSGWMQIRLLTGDPPADNSTITGGTSGATGDVNGTVVPSEDPRQLRLNTTLSAAAETAVVCTASIPTDTPTSGTIRVQLNSNIYRVVPFASYASATFTLGTASSGAVQIDANEPAGTFTRASGNFLTDGFVEGMRFTTAGFVNGGNNAAWTVGTVTATVITVVTKTGMVTETGSGDETATSNGHDFSTDNATGGAAETGNSIFISYIDKLATSGSESFTGVYSADRNLFVRVRDGGGTPIKTFETTGTLGSAGGSATPIRTSDA